MLTPPAKEILLMRRLTVVVVVACAAVAGPAFAASSVSVPSKFSSVLAKTRSKSDIAVRLPSRIPVDVRGSRVKGTLEDVGAGQYHLALGIGRSCHEATACFVAAFYGRKGAGLDIKRKVSLARGVTGRFRPITCGASCSAAEIQWKQGGVAYAIQYKGTKRKMVALANSAIRGGAR
jgi:hypothetical protein